MINRVPNNLCVQQRGALDHIDSLLGEHVIITVDDVDDANGNVKDLFISLSSVHELPGEFPILFYHAESLTFHVCRQLTNLSLLLRMRNLKALHLRKCPVLRRLPPELCNTTELRTLSLFRCTNFDCSSNVPILQRLEEFNFEDESMRRFPKEFSSLSNIKRLCLECPRLNDVIPAETGPTLKRLELRSCNEFDYSSNLHCIQRLEELNLEVQDQDIEEAPVELWLLSNLKTLCLSMEGLKMVPNGVGNLQGLENLSIEGARVASISREIGKLVNLENLSFGCPAVTELPDEIGGLMFLKSLVFHGFSELQKLPALLLEPPNLEELALEDCYSLSISTEDVVECTDSLVRFDCGDHESFVDAHQLIRHMVLLNRAGRRLLKRKDVTLALWSIALGRCCNDADSIFFFLKEKHQELVPNTTGL